MNYALVSQAVSAFLENDPLIAVVKTEDNVVAYSYQPFEKVEDTFEGACAIARHFGTFHPTDDWNINLFTADGLHAWPT